MVEIRDATGFVVFWVEKLYKVLGPGVLEGWDGGENMPYSQIHIKVLVGYGVLI